MSEFRLERADAVVTEPPALDAEQQQVVDHRSGPLLVLGGPGTGKTATLVEAVVRRIQQADAATPAVPLALTFSRRAGADLRLRISRQLGRSTLTPRAMTFHAFCFALLRRFAPVDIDGPGVRLLTAPEQEFRVRETLAGMRSEQDLWPDSIRRAVGTRAFAGEVRAVLAKARHLGLDPEDLIAVGERSGRPEWAGAGEFMAEYLDVLDFEGVLDYSELVHRCRILLTDPHVVALLRAEIDGIYLDEFQDTDSAQAQLVAKLAGPGGSVVAFGDPDQSIYAFRGARARGILDFPDQFRTATGAPSPMIALGTTRRLGSRLAHATRRVAERLPLHRPLPPAVRQALRAPQVDPAAPKGRVEVYTYESAGAEAEHVADILRQAHLHDRMPWSEMAVLVRSGRRKLPGLSRALTAAGVPIEVAGDEIALSAALAVRPLLLALEVALAEAPDADQAARLLQSPLGGLDSIGLRRLGRRLREAERAELAGAGLPALSAELCRRALADPTWLADCQEVLPADQPEVGQAGRLAELLQTCRDRIGAGNTAEEVLWTLWSGTDWPHRLRAEALRGGEAGRRADRDLDVVCALFDIAARSEELVGARGVQAFLAEVEAQQIPADTQREADTRGKGVRLMTAHRAKGLEWRLVVLASVQEGLWPDLRMRGSLLDADRLGTIGDGVGLTEPAAVSVRLAEERRLFYVACTRARERLVVSAVEGTEGEGDQPSRFVSELGVIPVARAGRPARPLTLAALVGELRRISVDPDSSPALRDAAAVRLARLADATDHENRCLAPGADPARWWGLRELTEAAVPLLLRDEPVRISGSTLGALLSCPRQWFLSRRAMAEPGRQSAAGTGDVIHVLLHHAAEDDIDVAELAEHLDLVWDRLGFDAAYLSAIERAEAEAMLERYAAWCTANSHRELVGTEVPFAVTVPLPGDTVQLHGTVDRLQRGPDGRLHIVDFKTGRSSVDKRDLPSHEQLGVYQLAAAEGAFAEVGGGTSLGGAELVYLRRQDSGDLPYPEVLPQASLTESPHLLTDPPEVRVQHPTWVHARLAEAARIIRSERFDARVGPGCRWCAFATSCPSKAGQVVE